MGRPPRGARGCLSGRKPSTIRSLAAIPCFLPPVSLLILLIYLKELGKRRGLRRGPARGLRHPTPTPASQRSHPAPTKSHFPTNSLSEAAGQVINHREPERRGKGGCRGGGARAQMGRGEEGRTLPSEGGRQREGKQGGEDRRSRGSPEVPCRGAAAGKGEGKRARKAPEKTARSEWEAALDQNARENESHGVLTVRKGMSGRGLDPMKDGGDAPCQGPPGNLTHLLPLGPCHPLLCVRFGGTHAHAG